MHETAEQYRLLAIGARAMAIRSAPPQSGVYREEAAAYERMAALADRQGHPEQTEEQCGSCHFIRSGRCRRLPPYLPSKGETGFWLYVDDTDWCGEWKPKS